jgi:predicted transposase YbfD/YdcC
MQKVLENLQIIDNYDIRQQGKTKYPLSEIIGIAFFAMAANANDCVDIANFAKEHKPQLQTIFTLKHGVPSHDTIYRAFAMISPEYLQTFQKQFNELLNSGEGEKIRKILSIDGKTQCGNGNSKQSANHIVSVVDENGFCLGQEPVADKSNEITAIPELIASLNVAGQIVTMDAMGTQRDIVKMVRKKRADYVLTLKGNQGLLFEEVSCCFDDTAFLSRCEYYQTLERARVVLRGVNIGI